MKKRNISHWEKNQYTSALLLFVEALEEGTFHYSFESYRMPALNCHYLCYDIIQTANDIERKVLMDGNFTPLSEEFEQVIKEDIFIKSCINDKDTLLYAKDKNANYYDLSLCDLKTKINRYPEIATFIKDVCEAKNAYLKTLLNLIITNIFTMPYSYENSSLIYVTSRALISDLVNSGYSKEYLYNTIIDYFFNSQKPVKCNEDTVIGFFNCFTFDEHNYQVVFGINKKATHVLKKLNDIEVRKATICEKGLLNLQRADDSVAVFKIETIDPYTAFIHVSNYTNIILALHRINQHESRLFITPKAIVAKQKDDDTYENGKLIYSAINPIRKKGNLSDFHALFDDITLMNNIDMPISFYRAISLHNGAIESKDISNQLLNLWTIIEVLIDTKRDNEDKINTICSTLGAILNRCYIYSCIEQLLTDIRSCSDFDIDAFLSQVETQEQDIDNIEKFTLILSLEKYKDSLLKILSSVEDYPLLEYRIKMYSDHIFDSSKSIYEHLYKHGKRVKWHIMRIYRNRNMIVHNGDYMPYRDIIVENLHYYVDVLIDTLIEYYYTGLLNHASIYKNILSKEASHYALLGISMNKKSKSTTIQLTEENALQLIFNGYNGNMVKKSINRVINEKRKSNNGQLVPKSTNRVSLTSNDSPNSISNQSNI